MSGIPLCPFDGQKAKICTRTFHLVQQAAARPEWAEIAANWIVIAQKWAVRQDDMTLAIWLGKNITACLVHKWAA